MERCWHQRISQASAIPIVSLSLWGILLSGTAFAARLVSSHQKATELPANGSGVIVMNPLLSGSKGLTIATANHQQFENADQYAFLPPMARATTEAEALAKLSDEAAPSPLWLIVMPAIPLVGGGLIYGKRRLLSSGPETANDQSHSETQIPNEMIARTEPPENPSESET